MNENIKAFLKKVAEDKSLAAKLEACKSPNEAYAVASGAVEGFAKEEFFAAMEQIKASTVNKDELSEADLAKMAGGSLAGTTDIISLTAWTVSGAAAAAAI